MIQLGLLAPLYRTVSDPRPRRVVPKHGVGQGHRDHGSPPPGACSRASAARPGSLSSCRSSHARCTQQVVASCMMALIHGHPGHAAAVAPGGGQTQVAAMEEAAWSWSTAEGRRVAGTRRSTGAGEPKLGMCPDPGRTAKARDPRLGHLDPSGPAPSRPWALWVPRMPSGRVTPPVGIDESVQKQHRCDATPPAPEHRSVVVSPS